MTCPSSAKTSQPSLCLLATSHQTETGRNMYQTSCLHCRVSLPYIHCFLFNTKAESLFSHDICVIHLYTRYDITAGIWCIYSCSPAPFDGAAAHNSILLHCSTLSIYIYSRSDSVGNHVFQDHLMAALLSHHIA